MKKIKAYCYTKGKFGKGFREIRDTYNDYLYSMGRYPTQIKRSDLPEYYIEFRSRTVWYMTGYIKVNEVVDVKYESTKLNHLFKDDYLYISYTKQLRKEKSIFGWERYYEYDMVVCGNDIIPILLAIEKYSNYDISDLKKQVNEKVVWFKENYEDDYKRQFKEGVIDIFEYYINKCE